MKSLPEAFDALTHYKQFVTYVLKPNKKHPKKNDKLPADYRTGNYPVDAQNPSNWTDINTAIKMANMYGDSYGVGFVLTKDDPFWFLDIDNCMIESEGKSILTPLAKELINQLPYAAKEISSSRKGVHIIGSGNVPAHGCKNTELGIEFYNEVRFIALTGYHATGDAGFDCSAILPSIINKYFSLNCNSGISSTRKKYQQHWDKQVQLGTHPEWSGPLDDDQLLQIMLQSKSPQNSNEINYPSFADLFNNDDTIYSFYDGDLSRIDFALAKKLAFATGNNCIRMENFMQRSRLREDDRSKWDDREDYLKRTILEACSQQKKFYNQNHKPAPVVTLGIGKTLGVSHYPQLNLMRTKPLNTHENLNFLLDFLNIKVRWNDMSRTREVIIPNFPGFSDDLENLTLNEIINLATINHMPTSRIDEHLNSLAQRNHYHPIVDCIISKPWDGVSRFNPFIKTLRTTNDEFSHVLIRKWMLAAIAAVFSEKGFPLQGVLVLQGKQNIGKTRWVKSLDPINCKAVKEGALLDPSNKDSLITCACYWIVELGELDATFRKSDIARIKSHITSEVDIVRFPYARKNSRLTRRTAYVATVNESRYLIDDTGNRRWWTMEILQIDLNHGLDMQQVWAEVYHCWKQGETPWLSQHEINQLNQLNMEFEQLDPFEEKILTQFDWREGWLHRQTVQLTATDALAAIDYKNPTRSEATRMGKILTKLTGKKPDRRYHMIPVRKPTLPSPPHIHL